MIPGGVSLPENELGVAEEKMRAWRVLIQSMTKKELEEPRLVDGSRARRIARGSGRAERGSRPRELVLHDEEDDDGNAGLHEEIGGLNGF